MSQFSRKQARSQREFENSEEPHALVKKFHRFSKKAHFLTKKSNIYITGFTKKLTNKIIIY